MKMNTKMKFVSFIICSSFLFTIGVSQSDIKAPLLGQRVTMVCPISSGQIVQWKDVRNTGSTTTLYTRSDSGVVTETPEVQSDPKYREYDYDASSNTQFNLIIQSVKVTDDGNFLCVNILNNDDTLANVSLSVNAEPESVSITCVPNEACPDANLEPTTSSQFACTCTAINAYPDSLDLTWDGAVEMEAANRVPSTNKTGFFNIIGTAAVTPTDSSNTVTCTVTGYTSDIPDAHRRASYSFAPPTCTVTVNTNPDCTTAEVQCNCENPGIPESSHYLFYDGTDYEPQDSDKWIATIVPSEPYSFFCRGCNGVNYGTGSSNVSDICVPTPVEPSTEPPADTSTKGEEHPTEESPAPVGLIVGLVVGGCVLVVVVIVVVVMLKKNELLCFETKDGNDTGGGSTNNRTEKSLEAAPGDKDPQIPAYRVNKTEKSAAAAPGDKDNEIPEYGVVNKPKKQPEPAPRNTTNMEELQYADLDHGKHPPSNVIHIPQDAPTEYATVQSVIV